MRTTTLSFSQLILSVILVFGLAGHRGPAPAERAEGQTALADSKALIVGLDTRLVNEQVLVSFILRGAFDAELAKRVESGLPTGFDYRIRLVRERRRWFDSTVAGSNLEVMAMYNAVTREYLINYKHNGSLFDSRVVRDAASLRRALTRIDALPAFDLGTVPDATRERRLKVQVRAELGTGTFLFFFPTTITTEWAESDTLIPEPRPTIAAGPTVAGPGNG